jgi:hypothetical protein
MRNKMGTDIYAFISGEVLHLPVGRISIYLRETGLL